MTTIKNIVKRRLPPSVLQATRLVRPKTWRDARPFFTPIGYVRVLRLINETATGDGTVVPVNVKPLGGAIYLRRGSTDTAVLFDAIEHRYHLPPPDLQPARIWDLGANVGITTAHLAMLYPNAKVTGVEPDRRSAGLAVANTRRFGDRVGIIEAAVWTETGIADFAAPPRREFAGRLGGPGDHQRVLTYSLNDLLASDPRVDYLKVDIEGAEEQVFTANTEWAAKVRCLKVEVHPPYTMSACRTALEQLGFTVEADGSRDLCLVATRRD